MIPVSFADSAEEVEAYLARSLNTLRNIKSLHRTYVDCIAAIRHCFRCLRGSSLKQEEIKENDSLLPHVASNGTSSPPSSPSQQDGKLVWGGFEDGFDELQYL